MPLHIVKQADQKDGVLHIEKRINPKQGFNLFNPGIQRIFMDIELLGGGCQVHIADNHARIVVRNTSSAICSRITAAYFSNTGSSWAAGDMLKR